MIFFCRSKEGSCDIESESGYGYKKKLQKKLFDKNEKNFIEECGEKKKSKKRKSCIQEINDFEEPKRKRIKLEPESDLDKQHKKKKSQTLDFENIQNPVDFLNYKVKEEQLSGDKNSLKSKTKKKKKHKEVHVDSPGNEEESIAIVNPNENDSIINISELNNEEYDTNKIQLGTESEKQKKKKSKKKKEKVCMENSVTQEENITMQYEDTVDTTILDKLCTAESKIQTLVNNSVLYENSQSFVNRDDESDISKINSSQLNTTAEKIIKSALSQNGDKNDIMLSCGGVQNKISQRISKISDRIRFEDEDTSEFNDDNQHFKNNNIIFSAQFQKYLKANTHLKKILPSPQSDSIISEDDEVWVIKCPSEIDVKNFKGSSLILDTKCKLKVDSQTFVGFNESSVNNMTFLTLDQRKPVIKNITLNGLIHLHKRIPKPHFVLDNNMINNQTNFIPLPETKCRHPLFGINYRSAIKVPKHVAERLNGIELESSPSDVNDKTKKNKRKRKIKNNLSDCEPEPKTEPEIRQKKKKRKRSRDSATPPKSAKRRKHDPDSAETWESEKGIEQQLFNF